MKGPLTKWEPSFLGQTQRTANFQQQVLLPGTAECTPVALELESEEEPLGTQSFPIPQSTALRCEAFPGWDPMLKSPLSLTKSP